MPGTIATVMAVYNATPWIARAIESVLRQERAMTELIVVDDGSTDRTGEVVASYGDQIRLVRIPRAG